MPRKSKRKRKPSRKKRGRRRATSVVGEASKLILDSSELIVGTHIVNILSQNLKK